MTPETGETATDKLADKLRLFKQGIGGDPAEIAEAILSGGLNMWDEGFGDCMWAAGQLADWMTAPNSGVELLGKPITDDQKTAVKGFMELLSVQSHALKMMIEAEKSK